jgi:hypothetical protein
LARSKDSGDQVRCVLTGIGVFSSSLHSWTSWSSHTTEHNGLADRDRRAVIGPSEITTVRPRLIVPLRAADEIARNGNRGPMREVLGELHDGATASTGWRRDRSQARGLLR